LGGEKTKELIHGAIYSNDKMLAASITTQPWDQRKSFNSLNKRFKQVLGAVGAAAIRAGALWRNHAQ
jgi:hypothetical protein